ncbi:MAG: M3 family metallopeptidase [Bacteroidales bacterium]|nr:M3 family metallopeptidase [Bacteroidales bacterium]
MRKSLIPFVLILIVATMSCKQENPLLAEFATPYQTPPFDRIRPEHYVPAVRTAIDEARAEVEAIASNPAAPTFENTLAALDRSGKHLDAITEILFNLNEAETNPALQAVVREVSPLITDFSNDISLNPKLFDRIRAVWEARDTLGLNTEQATLLAKTYRQFEQNGACLDEAGKERFREISRRLADLSLQFGENELAANNAFVMHLTDSADLAGLPPSLVAAAAQAAKERNLEGWAITLHAPMYIPFMRYSERRDLREKLNRAYGSRGLQPGEHCNQQIIKDITSLRLEKAKLLGHKTHADLVLQQRMAETPANVFALEQQLLDASRPAARREVEEVQQFAQTRGFNDVIQRWDWPYYSYKLKMARYSYDEEELKPYLSLDSVVNGVFLLAHKLYGLTFTPNATIPLYHPDVRTYEVHRDGRLMAILYLDFFPREGKSGGAWKTTFRSQYRIGDTDVRPLVSIVTNFTKPTADAPALLTFGELETLLHEFGHALHAMLSECTYQSVSGTAVYRDFVELPSQIMENWASEKEYLDLFATHHLTGQKIPQELVQKVVDSRNFTAGYLSLRQISLGLLDMAWHTIEQPVEMSVEEFEAKAIGHLDVFPAIAGMNTSTAFGHIFAGGYAAGYYGYKWAEVLDADAFELFKQRGIFDRATAESFRDNILSRGGSEHPMVLYTRFRGHQPTAEALLKRSGLK